MLHPTSDAEHTQQSNQAAIQVGRWMLFIYHVPTEPSSARAAIWRETKRLGALSMQHAVCLLPVSEAHRAAYGRLARRVEEYGGDASVFETSSPNDAWQEKIVARFNAARNEEYEEVIDEAERFREEIARERRKEKFTFAEQEDEESNLERLRKYLGQVQARDMFNAPGQARAAAEVEQCADVLDAFIQEIFEHQSALNA
ncbi:MAG: Chromate resistance protein ChrB [Chloroflexota bacterium]